MIRHLTNLQPTVLSLNNITGQLSPTLHQKDLIALQSAFAIKTPGAEYSPAYALWKKTSGKSGWNGLTRFIDDSLSFGAGLFPSIATFLTQRGYSIQLRDNRIIPPVNYGNTTVSLRDYQEKVIKEILSNTILGTWWPRGVLHLPVGAGKTEIAVSVYQTIPAKTLILQNKQDLVRQTKDRFEKYGITAGVFGTGKHETDRHLTIATVQALHAAWKRNPKAAAKFLESFQQVFVDEAHELLSGKNISIRILNKMPNCFFRWALSATAFDRDIYSALSLISVVGPISSVLGMNDLTDQGYLSRLSVRLVEFKHDGSTPSSWPECLDIGIVNNYKRNTLIVNEVNKLPKPVLVMTPRVEHAYKLDNLIKQSGLKSIALTQEQSLDTRTKAIKDIQNGNLDVIVATTIFDQGVDIPELRAMLLAAGGKSRVKAIQRIGRVMRKTSTKSDAIVVDILDRSNRILREHSSSRLKIWEEFGFTVLKDNK